jgi:hypothetical protein
LYPQKFERRYKRSLHNKKDNLGLKWYVTQATDGAMVKKIMEKIVENVTGDKLPAAAHATYIPGCL